jgi:hypothetical protein
VLYCCECLRSGRYPEQHSHVPIVSVAATETEVEGEEVVDPDVMVRVPYVEFASEKTRLGNLGRKRLILHLEGGEEEEFV